MLNFARDHVAGDGDAVDAIGVSLQRVQQTAGFYFDYFKDRFCSRANLKIGGAFGRLEFRPPGPHAATAERYQHV